MAILLPHILISADAVDSVDAYDVVLSNVLVVNAAREARLGVYELHPDAMRAYWVDYYRAQIETGGFAQFAFNSRLEPMVRAAVREGLEAVGARDHAVWFERAWAGAMALDAGAREAFLASDFQGHYATKEALGALDDELIGAIEADDLMYLVRSFLLDHPDTRILDADAMEAALAEAVARIENPEDREQAALDAEPEVVKQARALCAIAGLAFQGFTGVEGHELDGEAIGAYHLMASGKKHILTRWSGSVVLLDATTRSKVASLDA